MVTIKNDYRRPQHHSHFENMVFRHEIHGFCFRVRLSTSSIRPLIHPLIPQLSEDRWNAQHNPPSGFNCRVSSQLAVPRRPPGGGSAQSHSQIAFCWFSLMERRQHLFFFLLFLCSFYGLRLVLPRVSNVATSPHAHDHN